MSEHEIELRREATRLRSEMEKTRAEIRAGIEEFHQKKIESRVLPPMAQMTRLQKRYFLEPWWTVGWVGSWLLSVPAFIVAMFTWMHVQFSMLGLLFVLSGAAFGTAKIYVADWNSRTEGRIAAANSQHHEPGCRCTRCY